jgi:hypothetical protein
MMDTIELSLEKLEPIKERYRKFYQIIDSKRFYSTRDSRKIVWVVFFAPIIA